MAFWFPWPLAQLICRMHAEGEGGKPPYHHKFVRNSKEICQEVYKEICYDKYNRGERQKFIGYVKAKKKEKNPRKE